ncbi:MAG: RluA family pseudouridine synthase [Dehalococcoidaceae bacterium]|nr:RluA family pseudouridine synthase [Dehalococcoidaceae bacterium]
MEAGRNLTVSFSGQRLDVFVTENYPGLSRSRVRKLIDAGCVTVNAQPVKPGHRLEEGDIVTMSIPEPAPSDLVAQKMPLNIVYEDGDLMIVDKPAGLSVHPGAGHPDGTLVNALLGYCPDICGGDVARPGIVHRLDKDTSGLIIVAKNPVSHQYLADQFKNREISKTYIALVKGRLMPEEGFIEAPIGRDRSHRKRMAISTQKSGRSALTGYRVIRYYDKHTLLEVKPETGRTHQIRVHLAAIGHPIVGDNTYGAGSAFLSRQFLHASRLVFRLPSSGMQIEFNSPLPPDLERALYDID